MAKESLLLPYPLDSLTAEENDVRRLGGFEDVPSVGRAKNSPDVPTFEVERVPAERGDGINDG